MIQITVLETLYLKLRSSNNWKSELLYTVFFVQMTVEALLLN